MKIKVSRAPFKDKSIIQNMLQLYIYDFSEFEDYELDENGLFKYDYLDQYWLEEDRYPFIIRGNGNLAGFALLNRQSFILEKALTVAEFFVLRRYRRRGIGRKAAFTLFDRFHSDWEIRQIKTNTTGQLFWRKIIGEYTGGNFQEYENTKGWGGPIQVFRNNG